MKMTSQPSTSGLPSIENICELSNNLAQKMDNCEGNVCTKVFTKEEEISLLKQIREDEQSLCTCKSCAMDRLKSLAYQVACKKKKLYPKSWNKNRQVEQKWLEKFEERHKDETSKFPSICKKDSQASTSRRMEYNPILRPEDERLLLIQLQEMETRHGCKCKNYLLKEPILPILAYKLACKLKRNPQSWDAEGKATAKWVSMFKKRHSDKISKFSNDCNCSVLTEDDEQLLLTHLQEVKARFGCKYKNYFIREMKENLARKISHDLDINYPEWREDENAVYKWLRCFEERHKIEISIFPSICKEDLSQTSTSRRRERSPILKPKHKRLLLIQLQEMETQHGCKCKNCLLKELPILAYKFACNLKRNSKAWDAEGKAPAPWVSKFKKMYEDEISKFSTVCNRLVLTNRSVLTNDEEQLLLTHLQDVKVRGGCKCKRCFEKDMPLLAKRVVYDLNKNYPEWKGEEHGIYKWLRHFEERHKIEISEFPTVCEAD